jgi:hypothetical protein
LADGVVGGHIHALLVNHNCHLSDPEIFRQVKETALKFKNMYLLVAVGEDGHVAEIITSKPDGVRRYAWKLGAAEIYYKLGKVSQAHKYMNEAKAEIPTLYAEDNGKVSYDSPGCLAHDWGVVWRDWVSYEEGEDFISSHECKKRSRGVSDIQGERESSPDYFLPAYQHVLASGTKDPYYLKPFVNKFIYHHMYDEALVVIESYHLDDQNALAGIRSQDYRTLLTYLLWQQPAVTNNADLKRKLWIKYMTSCMGHNSEHNAPYLNSPYYRQRECYVGFLSQRRSVSGY